MEFFNYLRTQNEYLKKVMESNPSLASLLSETKLMTSTSFNYEEVFKDVKRFHDVLNRIISISYKPKIKVSTEEDTVRSELVSSMDPETYQETFKDPKLWKRKMGKLSPEYVHIRRYVDSLVTYENNFIALLIDILERKLNESLALLIPFTKSLEEQYGVSGLNFGKYSLLKDFNMFKSEYVNVFKGNKINTQDLVKLILNGLKKIKNIKESELYRLNKNKLKVKSLVPTNILLHEPLYAYCYRFYLDNFLKEGDDYIYLNEVSYYNYVTVNIIRCLDEYLINKDKVVIKLNESNLLTFKNVTAKINHFTLKIECLEDELAYLITLNLKGNEAVYKVNVTYKLDKQNQTILKHQNQYVDTFLITHTNVISHFDRVVNISSYSKKNIKTLTKLFSSLMLLSLDELDSYHNRCPICGCKEVINEGEDKICLKCGSRYSHIKIKNSPFIWLKSLRRAKDE